MGNLATRASKGAGARKIRVLLPDGNILLLDGPVEAADLMIEHVNHMVVHCSAPQPGSMGKRPNMAIMQPQEMLQPGHAYVVHPIPAQYTMTKFQPQPPQPLSVLKSNIGKLVDQEDGDKTQEQTDPRKKSARRSSLKRFQSKVADSTSGRDSKADAAQVPELNSGAPQTLSGAVAREPREEREDHAYDEGEYDDEEITLNLNMYMGWRPALESIPESPTGYNYQLDMMQAPPMLCA